MPAQAEDSPVMKALLAQAESGTRPEPGKLIKVTGVGKGFEELFEGDAWDLGRSGDAGTAIVTGLIDDREKMASNLHYKLVKMRDELDYAARRLEDGDRRHVISRNNWYADLPIQIDGLQQQHEAVEDANRLRAYAQKVTPVSTSFALAQAADALETLDADRHAARLAAVIENDPTYDPTVAMLPPNTLVIRLREQAATIRRLHEERLQREADEKKAARDAAKAKRLVRPLGAIEKRVLTTIHGGGPNTSPYRESSNEAKAFTSLIERGMIELHPDAEQPRLGHRNRGPFVLTQKGRDAIG